MYLICNLMSKTTANSVSSVSVMMNESKVKFMHVHASHQQECKSANTNTSEQFS